MSISSTPSVPTTTPPKSDYSGGYRSTPYYPRTDTEFGLMWNDGEVEKTTGVTPDEAIRLFMNSIKLARIGVRSSSLYVTYVVTRQVEKTSAKPEDHTPGDWEKYELTKADLLKLYRAG